MGDVWPLIAAATHELTLLAAVGLLLGGLDDLAIDVVFFARLACRRLRGRRAPCIADLAAPPQRLAVFVPAWDEAGVIGPMLSTALARWAGVDVAIYVGVYPNDWDTIEAVAMIAETDRRVRLTIGNRAGPTTKADCLNTMWRAMLDDEMLERRGFDAVVLHDAEDVVHCAEPVVFAHYLRLNDAVQLPVLPLPHPSRTLVGGTYLDEFADAHVKQLVVRQALGAALPLAGVGCAFRRDLLGEVAAAKNGMPFDANSLTEDYELGLTIHRLGGRVAYSDVRAQDGWPVAVRALFPGRLAPAVRQRARWMAGIAFSGWDRMGWSGARHIADHWMRMRDRRAPIGVIVLAAAYLAAIGWAATYLAHLAGWTSARPFGEAMRTVLAINAALLLWRLAMRAIFTGSVYGWGQALRAPLRMVVSNIVAMIAARRALATYLRQLSGGPVKWDKTRHRFPDSVEGQA